MPSLRRPRFNHSSGPSVPSPSRPTTASPLSPPALPSPTAPSPDDWPSYQSSPARFFSDVLGWTPWSKQLEIAEAVRDALLPAKSLPAPSGVGASSRGRPSHSLPNTLSTFLIGEGGRAPRPGEVVPPGEAFSSPSIFSSSSVSFVVKNSFSGSRAEPLRRVAVRSGNGVGKTAIAARIMLWVLRCWPRSLVVTTAPTTRQVNDLLWRESRNAYHKARVPLGGNFYAGQPRWDLSDDSYAVGLSPETTHPERFQGYHAETILFIVDEASAVPPAHWEAIAGSLLSTGASILAIGNPIRLYGEFYDAFHTKSALWRTIAISAFDTPNFSQQTLSVTPERVARHGGPGEAGVGAAAVLSPLWRGSRPPASQTLPSQGRVVVPDGVRFPGLVTPEAVAEAREDWGEDSPLWAARILGAFPKAGENSLISLDWLEQAAKRWEDVEAAARAQALAPPEPFVPEVELEASPFPPPPPPPPKLVHYALGVDVARSGADATAFVLFCRDVVANIQTFHGQDTMRTAAKIIEFVDAYNRQGESFLTIAVDDGGVGGGVVDRLRELQTPSVFPVNFGSAPTSRNGKTRFVNKVSEMFWVLREELREGKIALPQHRKMWPQLTQIEWEMESDRAIRVHKRGLENRGRSPDLADALALAVEAKNLGGPFATGPYNRYIFFVGPSEPTAPDPDEPRRKTKFVYSDIGALISDMKRDRRERY